MGIKRLNTSQKSTIFMLLVLGNVWVTPINIVVKTNITVTLTATIASKYLGLKYTVECPTMLSKNVGRYVVIMAPVSLLPRTIFTSTAPALSSESFILVDLKNMYIMERRKMTTIDQP